MPTPLRQHQYELSNLDGSNSLVFGTEDTGYLTLDRPQHSGGEPRTNDVDRSEEDGPAFSRDFRTGKKVAFTLGVLTDAGSIASVNPHFDNLDYLDRIESLWQDDDFRNVPGRMAMLRACEVTGRTVRAYGRPRQYGEAAGKFTQQGFTPVACEFDLTDNAWYSDEEHVVDATLIPANEGGFVAPLVAPITTFAATSGTPTVMVVAGNRATWPVIEFHGPVTDASVQIGAAYTVGIRGHIAYDETIVFDPAPWVRSAYRVGDDAGWADRLTATTPPMKNARIKPGTYGVNYRGVDPTGDSYVRVRWRTARSRP